MKKMKKALAVLAAISMMMSMVSCGGSDNSTPDTTSAGTTVSTDASAASTEEGSTVNTAAETTAAASTEAITTTAAAAQAPADSHELIANNTLLGLSAKIYVPQIENSELKDLLSREDDHYSAYKQWYINAKDGSGQIYSFQLQIKPVDKQSLKSSESNSQNTKKEYGNGLTCFVSTSESNGRITCDATCYNEGYLDGYIQVSFRAELTKDGATEADALAYVEKALPYLKLIGDASNTKTADGNLRMMLHEKDVSIPAKVKIAGNDCEITQRIGGSTLLLETQFQTTESKFKIGTSTKASKKSFEKETSPETTIAGLPAKIKVEASATGTLDSILYLLINDRDCLSMYCRSTGFLDGELLDAAKKLDKVKEMVNEQNIAKTTEMFAGFYNDFVGAMKIECAGESSGTAATTAATTTATTAAMTTTAAATTPAAQTTKQQANNGPDSNSAGGEAYTEEELAAFARRYYGLHSNYSPEYAAVTKGADGTVTIQLYDQFDGHNSTCEWYFVNEFTGEGESLSGQKVNITDDSCSLWFPDDFYYGVKEEDWGYSTTPDAFARVLYIGKMQKGSALDQQSLQKLITNTTGAREYVNHYDYINEIPDKNMFSTEGGEEVFMIIPTDKNAKIRIETGTIKSDGTMQNGSILCNTYTGQPIILRCNKNGKSDVNVYIKGKDSENKFRPTVVDGYQTDCGGEKVIDLAFPFN